MTTASRSVRGRRIRVLCVDDHRLVREGMALIINRQPDMEVVAAVATGEEALALYKQHRPDIVLMDLGLRTMTGHEAIRRIRALDNESRIIVVTMHDGDEDMYRALRDGARGYLLKDTLPDDLVQAVRSVCAGGSHVSSHIEAKLRARESQPPLTPREIEVLQMLANGGTRREIAERLNITEETIHVHLKNIYSKLQVPDRGSAVNVALRRGLVHID
jgi:two-component system NarL family response regulator